MNTEQSKLFTAIGLMSGTSIDGSIDAALIVTDGVGKVDRKCVVVHQYETPQSPRAFHLLMKGAELAVRQASGDMKKAEDLLHAATIEHLSKTLSIPSDVATEKKTELTAMLFGKELKLATIEKLANLSAVYHAEAVLKLLQEQKISPDSVDVIGYHGQTLYHNPARGVNIQVGDAALIAKRTGIDVVYDFRSNDVRNGGQGAPLAPLYHQALALAAGLCPAAILNLGGCSNLTVVSGQDSDLVAFDAGPGNGLLDRFMLERTGKAMDEDSAHALRGTVNGKVLSLLVENSIKKDGHNYLKLPLPKSLDIRDFVLIPELVNLSVEDGAATLSAFSAECIALGLDHVRAKGAPLPTTWILCGGGAFNPAMAKELNSRLEKKIGKKVTVKRADDVGWSAQGMEAELFAYLAVRSLKGLPLSMPGTTGVPRPLTGGIKVSA